jgi:hypothetical protein
VHVYAGRNPRLLSSIIPVKLYANESNVVERNQKKWSQDTKVRFEEFDG